MKDKIYLLIAASVVIITLGISFNLFTNVKVNWPGADDPSSQLIDVTEAIVQ